MPRGWLKHETRTVGKKISRGGSSRYSSKHEQKNNSLQTQGDKSKASRTRHLKPRRNTITQEQNVGSLIEKESRNNFNEHHLIMLDEETHNAKSKYQKQTSATTSQYKYEEKECPICCEMRPLFSLMKRCIHSHPPACRECLREIYVSQAQQDISKYPLRCYHPECSSTKPILAKQLIELDIFRSDEELEKHHRFTLLSKAYSAASRMIVYCPDCDFPKLIHSQDAAFCRKCKTRYNVGYDPLHNKRSTIKALEAIEKDKIGHNEGWTYCPGCKMIVSKGRGCNHMICYCGEEFYWDEVTVKPAVKMALAERVVSPNNLMT